MRVDLVAVQVFFYSQSIFANAQVHPDYIPFAVMATNAVNVIMTLVAVRQFASVQSAQLQTFKKFSSVYCRVNEKIKVSKSISFHAANARLQNGWNTYPVIGEEQRSVIIIHRRRRS